MAYGEEDTCRLTSLVSSRLADDSEEAPMLRVHVVVVERRFGRAHHLGGGSVPMYERHR